MSAEITKLLTVYGSIGEQVLKDALDKVSATHKTVNSVRSQVVSTAQVDSLQLLAREFTELLEKGRGPTSKGPSPEMIEFLTDYAQARGMEDPKSAAWGMAKKMNKEGDRTFKAGGRDVYTNVLNKFVEELTAECSRVFAGVYLREVKQAFKR